MENKIMDCRIGNNLSFTSRIFVVGVVLTLLSSCTEEEQQFTQGTAKVNARFLLESPSALGGKIVVNEAYLKLSHIQITGTSPTGDVTNISHEIPVEEAPYRLTNLDSSHAQFSLPAFAYEQLRLDLFPLQDTYELVFTKPVEAVPSEDKGNENPGNGEDTEGNTEGQNDEDDEESDRDDGDDRDDHDSDDNDDDDRDDEDKDRDNKDDHDRKDDKKKNKGKNENKGEKDKDDKDEDDKDDEDRDEDDGRIKSTLVTVDLDHFFQNAKPAMVVFATYQNNGQTTSMIFVLTGMSELSLPAKQNDSFRVILGAENSAEVSFDANHWFETLTLSELEAASKQHYRGQQVLFVHKDYNSDLYQKLVSQIESSADLNFLPPPGL